MPEDCVRLYTVVWYASEVALSISAGMIRTASGEDGVGWVVATGGGVLLGTAVGSGFFPRLQAVSNAAASKRNRPDFARTFQAPANGIGELYCPPTHDSNPQYNSRRHS